MVIPNTSPDMLQPPKWMRMEELILSNLSVDMNYEPLRGKNLQLVVGSESIASYFERSIDFLNTLVPASVLLSISS